MVPLTHPISVSALNGQSLQSITHTTKPVSLITSVNHNEGVHVILTDSPLAPVVLGHPWLTLHNPKKKIWTLPCHRANIVMLLAWVSACSSVSCSVLQDEHADLSNVPSEYLTWRKCLVSLELLLFDGSLHPCIDYQGLNSITVNNTDHLPLMSLAFEKLQGLPFSQSWTFVMPTICFRIREGVSARLLLITTGPGFWTLPIFTSVLFAITASQLIPSDHLELHHDVQVERRWDRILQTQDLFQLYSCCPDSSRQFVVEVDASELGVGTVLSQHSSANGRCIRILSPTERNYDIDNRELLESCWQSSSPWRSGVIGWKVRGYLSSPGLIIRTSSTSDLGNSRQTRWARLGFFQSFIFFHFLPSGFQKHQTRHVVPCFWPIWKPAFSRAHPDTEICGFNGNLGDWVEGLRCA